MSCRNSLTNRYTKQTFGKRLTCNMLSIGMIIQKNYQCDIPSSSISLGPCIVWSLVHQSRPCWHLQLHAHWSIFISKKGWYEILFHVFSCKYLLKCHEIFVFSVGSKDYHFFPVQAQGRNTRDENCMLCKGQSKESAVFPIILRQFQVIFSTTTLIFFTKLKFRPSFWGAEQVCILIGSWIMTQNANISISGFYRFCKKKSFVFLYFVSYLLNQLRIRPVQHLKMTVWTSVLWKILT